MKLEDIGISIESKPFKNDTYTAKRYSRSPIKIPSSTFRLDTTNKIQYFDADNTEECKDAELLYIYNSVLPIPFDSIASCSKLEKAFLDNGIDKKRVKYSVGWVFDSSDRQYPAFKAYVVVDDKYVFSFLKKMTSDFYPSYETEVLETVDEYHKTLPNTENYGKGQIEKNFFYIGSHTTFKAACELFDIMYEQKIKHGLVPMDEESIASLLIDGSISGGSR